MRTLGIFDRIKGIIWPSWRRNPLGKSVYFEDTGERVGNVVSVITGKEGKIVGYEIQDDSTNAKFHFPVEQIEDTRRGLLFRPLWYTEIEDFIHQLEFQETIMPELAEAVSGRGISKRGLHVILSKVDPTLRKLVDEALSLRDSLRVRLNEFEIDRIKIRKQLTTLTEKRLLGENTRREFAKAVLEQRRKIRIIEINIKRCRELLLRLEHTAFIPIGIAKSEGLRESEADLIDIASSISPVVKEDDAIEKGMEPMILSPRRRYPIVKEDDAIEKGMELLEELDMLVKGVELTQEDKIEEATFKCPVCDTSISKDASVCSSCGAEFVEDRGGAKRASLNNKRRNNVGNRDENEVEINPDISDFTHD